MQLLTSLCTTCTDITVAVSSAVMVQFWFRVNSSFVSYSAHPITVPKTQVPYSMVQAGNFCRDALIVAPDGLHIPGHIYHGNAGYGEYYEIRTRASVRDSLFSLPLGLLLSVEILRDDRATIVRLTPRPGPTLGPAVPDAA